MKEQLSRSFTRLAMRRTVLRRAVGLAFILSCVALTASAEPRVVPGSCQTVYGAEVCTWAETSGNQLVAMGATVPLDIIANAPRDLEMKWPPPVLASIKLPAEVKRAVGFDHLMMNWEHHGHPPGVFMTPHFDFHFYTMTPEEVARIDCSDTSKPGLLPEGYTLPDISIPGLGDLIGMCVPTMGMHGTPQADLEREGTFSASMITGYYAGRPIFIEPMITQSKLMEEKSFTMDVPRIANAPAGVRYPTRFRAEYDAGSRSYRLIFSGFEEVTPGP